MVTIRDLMEVRPLRRHFIKCIWNNEYESGIEHWINNKFKKKNVKIVGFIMLFIGISFLPQSLGKMMSEILEFFSYIVSFICWMLGLFLIEVASENA